MRVQGSGFRVQGVGFRDYTFILTSHSCVRFRVSGLKFSVIQNHIQEDFRHNEFRVWGLGFRVQGLEIRD